jgi:hypothetical protein
MPICGGALKNKMYSSFDMVVYEMFVRENNDMLQLLQPYRNFRVVDQLLLNKHMWSNTLNQLTVDAQELENFLMGINADVARVYPQYSERPREQMPLYFQRPFKSYEFSTFLDSGKQFYRDKIESIGRFIEMQQDQTAENTSNTSEYSQWLDRKLSNRSFESIAFVRTPYRQIHNDLKKFAEEHSIDGIDLQKLYDNTPEQTLRYEIWGNIKNSRSWQTDNPDRLMTVAGIEEVRRKIKNISTINAIEIPVIVVHNNEYHLITDDLVLMICRALQIHVEAVVVEL